MTFHKVNALSCYRIFDKTESEKGKAEGSHKSVSSEIDALGSACTGESAELVSSLNAVYNRVLTRVMSGAEQQVANAVSGGRQAVVAIQQGDAEMAAATQNAERGAHSVDEVRVTDGKRA